MVRFLLIVVAVWLAIMIARQLLRSSGGGAKGGATPPPRELPERDMVRCAECGLHVPKPEAVADEGGRFFCSERHRAAYRSRQG